MTMMNLLVGILATWRLSSLLFREGGPFEMFDRVREIAGVRHDEHGEAVADNQIGKMLSCFWCTSVWSALFINALEDRRCISLNKVLAYSAGAIFLGFIHVRLEQK